MTQSSLTKIDNNSLNTSPKVLVLYPYLLGSTWVFDDKRTGLKAEAFVLGTSEMITRVVESKPIPNAQKGFKIPFSDQPFEGYDGKCGLDSLRRAFRKLVRRRCGRSAHGKLAVSSAAVFCRSAETYFRLLRAAAREYRPYLEPVRP